MSRDEKREVIEILTEVIHNSHQSKDREVSGLFREIRDNISVLTENQNAIVRNEQEFQMFVREELSLIKEKAVLWNLSSKGFLAMIALAVTSLFGAIINFFIRH